MCKRGNYFIAMYDKYDNYVRDFDSIEDCAIYFHTSHKSIRNYIFREKKIENKYKLFKIVNCETDNLIKSL